MVNNRSSKKGLPTVRKNVMRVNKKSGKVSFFQQRYYSNPYNNKKGKNKAKTNIDNNPAEQFKNIIDNRKNKKISEYLDDIHVINGQVGVHTIKKLTPKIKTKKDESAMMDGFFNPILSEGFFSNDNISDYKSLLDDTMLAINSVPQTDSMCSSILNSLMNNKANISDYAMTGMLSSFQNHGQIEKILRLNILKKESYNPQDFLNEYMFKYLNPVNILNMYLLNDKLDSLSGVVSTLYSDGNDNIYLPNPIQLNETEIKLWNIWIDINNTIVRENDIKPLQQHLVANLDANVASALFKSQKDVDIPLSDTVIHIVSENPRNSVSDDFTVIKPVDLSNSDFDIHDASFIKDSSDNVFLSFILNISDIEKKDYLKIKNIYDDDIIDKYSLVLNDLIKDIPYISRDEMDYEINEMMSIFKSNNNEEFICINI
jgi:hypothetical protein